MGKMDVIGLHTEFFRNHGFVLNRSQFSFEKVFPHGKQVVFVHYVEENEERFLEYHLGIRINEVEELIHKYLPTLSNHVDQALSLAQTTDKLGNSYPKRIKLADQGDLKGILFSIEKFFLEKGFAWLDQMINPLVLEQEFLNHKEQPFEEFNLVESAFRSTALSKLYNPADYPTLRNFFLKKISAKEMTPFAIASFLQFLNYLDNLNLVAA